MKSYGIYLIFEFLSKRSTITFCICSKNKGKNGRFPGVQGPPLVVVRARKPATLFFFSFSQWRCGILRHMLNLADKHDSRHQQSHPDDARQSDGPHGKAKQTEVVQQQ